jgi:hypothetical protein
VGEKKTGSKARKEVESSSMNEHGWGG